MKLRLLLHEHANAYRNMAIDEALLNSGISTLRLYKWKPSAISIGYFQSMEEEVNMDACKKYGVDVVRRITGGGAVYHDSIGEITYSVVLPVTMFPDILESYKAIGRCLIAGLNMLGLKAEYAGINDVVVNGRKISGSAQTRRHGIILQHGTILLRANVKKMFSLLRVTEKKIMDKEIKRVEERVTSIEKEIGNVKEDEIREAMIKGFQIGLNAELEEGKLNENEIEDAMQLVKKYESREWNFKR
ncbi:MAG: lipoate--protein ligase family protein [Thermoplasmata archaeon]|nr:MAG: lipoate--protein ligase family protein [Thermoplasmata archaeon]